SPAVCRSSMFDVVVVGGGPVGACAAALLARGAGGAALRVALLEPAPPTPLPAAAPLRTRVVALSRASERILKTAGAWSRMPPERVSAYERMRVWHESVAPDSDAVLEFDAADVGEPNLGYIAENQLLPSARLVAASEGAFAAERDRASDLALGATRLLGARASFPLRRLEAQHYVVQRVALVGDAAHVVHPLAGQGVNLGLADAAALAQLVRAASAAREDPGARGVLRAYERWRRSEVALMSTAIDAFDRWLAHGAG